MEEKWFRETFHSLTIFMMQIKWLEEMVHLAICH